MADKSTDRKEKRARQFDFMAMLEEARAAAREKTQDKINEEAFEPEPDFPNSQEQEEDTESSDAEESGDDDADDLIGPPICLAQKDEEKGSENDDDDDEDDEDDEPDELPTDRIPVELEVQLNHGNKPITTAALDPSGARLITGSLDYEIKFFDFAGMDATLQSFRSIRPCESHPILSVNYNSSGELILVIAGNAQAKVIDRDGFVKFECAKGYQFIVDMASTKGHTGMLTAGGWHPSDRNEFMTASIDGSIRLWDVNVGGKNHKALMKARSTGGRRTHATAVTYSRDGRWLTAACQDGSIQVWDHTKPTFVNVAMHNKTAHQAGSDITSVCYSYDGRTLASRGGDDTLKLWDIRQFSKPLCVCSGLDNLYATTTCFFSPDDKLVVTGTSVQKGHGFGKLVFLHRENLERAREIPVQEGQSVIAGLWHPRLNQMVVGLSNGVAKLYYDSKRSRRGALLSTLKTRTKVKQMEFVADQAIITPYALPMFRQSKQLGKKKRDEKARKDPLKSHRPDLPVSGPGSGGRLGNKGATLSQYVVQQIVRKTPDDRDKDPRAAILRHAEAAEKNPYWAAPAYQKNQPKPIFQKSTQEEPVDHDIEPVWKKKKT